MVLPARCLDCGRDYSTFGMDLLLPRAQWLEIHPDEHGLLCAMCIVLRASKVPGATAVHAVIELAPSPEVCVCAAVLTEEGLVIRGHRHHDAMKAANLAFCRPKRGEEAQGFITSKNRYVNRQEGYRLQIAARVGSKAPGGYRGERLFSEDLY